MKITFPDEERMKEYARVPHPTDAEKMYTLDDFTRRLMFDSLLLPYRKGEIETCMKRFEKSKDPKDKMEMNQKILENADELSHFGYTMRTISVLRNSFSEPSSYPIGLKEIVKVVAGNYALRCRPISRKNPELSVDTPKKPCKIITHENLLYTLTSEILYNTGRSYVMNGSKKIRACLKLYSDASGYKISVSEEDNVIPEDYMERLFDGDSLEWKSKGVSYIHNTSRSTEQMLYILDSRIEVETGKGKGTKFTIGPIQNLTKKEVPSYSMLDPDELKEYGIKSCTINRRYTEHSKNPVDENGLILFKSLPEKLGEIEGSEKIVHIGGNYYAKTGGYGTDLLKFQDSLAKSGGEELRLFHGINNRATDLLLKNYSQVFGKEKVIMYSDLRKIDSLLV